MRMRRRRGLLAAAWAHDRLRHKRAFRNPQSIYMDPERSGRMVGGGG